ncbi:MAG TPA: HigA family addiction module antitoxin [Chthoniobacteraceae bacterium]|nr:HigA family addiction module antitoxin [Chthoniobacteraceae bacterium]
MTHQLQPWHPGEVIKEDFLEDYGLTQYALAKALNIPHSRLTEIIKGRRSVTTDTALRLARFYGNAPEFWLGLQSLYDLAVADWKAVEKEVRPLAKVA